MDILTLLEQATFAGLHVETQGGQLSIRGPKRAAALAEELGRRKAEAIAALSARAAPTVVEPPGDKTADEADLTSDQPSRVPAAQAPSESNPATITHEGKFYKVARTSGVWFFSCTPESGWTACSDEFAAIVEQKLGDL